MKASVAFIFFMLFLAGIAFVNLRGMQEQSENTVVTLEELTSSAWRPERLGEMRLEDTTEMFVQFETGGQISGSAGCNRFFGNYELLDEKLAVGPLGATRMACPEPAMSFEISFLELLQSSTTVVTANDRLTLRNDQGDTLVRLVAIERKTDE
jgi:heat shock protein HslJ